MMSRSFGDEAAHKCGVITNPETKIFKISKGTKGIVLASDGLTDKINGSLMSTVLEKYLEKSAAFPAAQELVKRAQIKWKAVGGVYLVFWIYG